MRALLAALVSALVVAVLVAPVEGVTLCAQGCTNRYQTPLGYLVPWGVAGWAIPAAVAVVAFWLARTSTHR
ncbi:hypothetical protein [Segeticoccus rhizosphaerae]|jgi:hypothetical protein|uniref:hypothetical protein n=1 Tax=Segeticoccus rhizosphaerae TaxID=1104777 RepID=UPI0010C0BDFC|nr:MULTISPECIES: hypothetical protein [Intrasporangiaceae]